MARFLDSLHLLASSPFRVLQPAPSLQIMKVGRYSSWDQPESNVNGGAMNYQVDGSIAGRWRLGSPRWRPNCRRLQGSILIDSKCSTAWVDWVVSPFGGIELISFRVH